MSRLRLWIALSLDGFVAGPAQDVGNPLGIGGMRLHEWVFPLEVFRKMHAMAGGEVNESSEVLQKIIENIGATVMGHEAREQAKRAAAGRDVGLGGGAQVAQLYLKAGQHTCAC